MHSVLVDPATKTALVQGGARGIDLDTAAGAYGLATPSGSNSDTGLGGLATGGGIGWLSRMEGLVVDNVLEMHVVKADGSLVVASAESNPDLFWALRGGGSHCGIAISFKLRLCERTLVRAGPVVHPGPVSAAACKKLIATADTFSNEYTAWGVFAHGPDGNKCFMGLPFSHILGEESDAVFKPLFEDPAPVAVMHQTMPYSAVNTMLNHVQQAGHWFERAMYFEHLSEETIDILAAKYAECPLPSIAVLLGQLGGKIADVPADATVYSARNAKWWVVILANYPEEAKDTAISFSEDLYSALKPAAMTAAYANAVCELPPDLDPYSTNKARLTELKAKHDPTGLFNGTKAL